MAWFLPLLAACSGGSSATSLLGGSTSVGAGSGEGGMSVATGQGGSPGQGGAGDGGAGGQGEIGGAGGQGGASASSASASVGGASSSSGSSSGVGGGPVQGELPDELPSFDPAELEPVPVVEGVPQPLPGVYMDKGPAASDTEMRGLIAFAMRDKAILEEKVAHMYDPAHPSFRKYMTTEAWMAAHGPNELDAHLVKLWLESQGFQVPRVATNRLLLEFTGTVGQFNAAFKTTLHIMARDNWLPWSPDFDVLGTIEPLHVPLWVAQRIAGIASADLAAEKGALSAEGGGVVVAPPPNPSTGRAPANILKAYDIDDLHALGHRGQGTKIGVTVGATFRFKDLQSFWQSFGIARADPIVVQTMEPIVTRYLETTLDVQWAGAIAPAAELIVYSGPDSRNTSMVYTFNEAIARNEVDVITNSFAHREDGEPYAVRVQYHDSALMAAALGITVVAAAGNSSEPDIPSVSPYVTGVGGTQTTFDAQGNLTGETAWSGSGSGASLTFLLPDWQNGVVTGSNGKRATADVAMNASPSSPYWVYWLGKWAKYGGTSFASPCFAGLISVVDGYRAANGRPRVGWLNPILYQNAPVKQTFRDIVTGGTPYHKAGAGWDYPTGWGAPGAMGLALAMP
jgi:kumamolisin